MLNAGDSPIGLRLPTQNLPFVSIDQIDADPTPTPLAPLEELDSWDKLAKAAKKRREQSQKDSKYSYFESDPVGKVRTALCLEVRDGVLYVFLPPISLIEPFLDQICSLELVAQETSTRICIEGYPPPHDLRIDSFKITPDPGVIEVNVPPSKTWVELSQLTSHVYEQARLSRLTAEKFLIDGQRVGTGGGNHIVLGGETPADSPFLRRPDLLRSLLTFWQNHPSLSYLFSSLFIGPTSQAPRIDEARHDSLYELELAFSNMPPANETMPYWLIDRVFRNILVDMTGNTHRTEFCIDKLFTPDSETGRLGLVEMRGFEMPPHPQMSLVQALFIRACIAKFWQKPCVEKLVRWHNQLHDRFMLPYYVWSDFEDVVAQINRDGYPIQLDWFRAHFEFRFPIIGQINVQGIHIEFRVALEPWHVLGEESYQGTVSRAVDSSVQRLQVMVSGDMRPHHVLSCNRKEVPLQRCNEEGTYVAGVRYKAWRPPHGLHPTVPVHTPLVFDLVDSRCQQSLGSCTIHAAHPGGRNYDTLPVNENEAEGRRLARFQAMGQHVGEIFVEPKISRPEFPCTLDLRFS
ncbi:Putative amidoligase enzyme [Pseudobacteriovorax antillogorgiicola]|uniref:Putative amidoligase enzyme n=1 Tax=Pseudobacteriovorax antillogorgiicola TaxID=1513793 RepID=A0A1Y6BWG9_9BACT|nr:putative amidoligase enzyme DUF2126 [Pseudobacteriovorax antillogorgiicola]SMF24623.1 Putative amidoligase enzyme [Pseudobacteriovorax antillogorgiicola]